MFYAIGWLLVLALLAFWSLGAWVFHSAGMWAIAAAGVLGGGSSTAALRLPDWLAPWIPPELAQSLTSLLSSSAPAIKRLIAWSPDLASGLSVLVWVVWAIGSVLLVMLGLALSGTTALLRRRAAARSPIRTPG